MGNDEEGQKITVAGLIAALGRFPQDARVLVSGYEEDLDSPSAKAPRLALVHLGGGFGCYMGDHKECEVESFLGMKPEDACTGCEKKIPVSVVVLIER